MNHHINTLTVGNGLFFVILIFCFIGFFVGFACGQLSGEQRQIKRREKEREADGFQEFIFPELRGRILSGPKAFIDAIHQRTIISEGWRKRALESEESRRVSDNIVRRMETEHAQAVTNLHEAFRDSIQEYMKELHEAREELRIRDFRALQVKARSEKNWNREDLVRLIEKA